MRNFILFAAALALCACEDEYLDPTFGLDLRVRANDLPYEQGTAFCIPPPPNGGFGRGSSIDDWSIHEEPPHLFIDVDPDGDADAFHVQVYIASERETDGVWWVPSEILAERVYDRRFGERGQTDSFMVEFEGQQYTVSVLGLPPDATCP